MLFQIAAKETPAAIKQFHSLSSFESLHTIELFLQQALLCLILFPYISLNFSYIYHQRHHYSTEHIRYKSNKDNISA